MSAHQRNLIPNSARRVQHLWSCGPFGAISLCAVVLILLLSPTGTASTLHLVGSADEIASALLNAKAGDIIEVRPGTYRITRGLHLHGSGTAERPIIFRASIPGTASILTSRTTLIKLFGPHWEIRGLEFRGADWANHALHLVEQADHVLVEGNRFRNFYAAIKANGQGTPRQFPDHVRIGRNVFLNDKVTTTRQPVAAIDIVGGKGWRIEENFIADITKERRGSHGAPGFVKGGAHDASFDRNLVICEWRNTEGRRIGLSLGDGGTGPRYFDRRAVGECDEDCPETVNSRMTNNIILNCPDEPGLYLNQAKDTLIANNTIFDAYGIQLRFPQTQARVYDNLLTGTIWEREGGSFEGSNNITTGWFDSASYIPSARAHWHYRISDYHILYPSWISESMVRRTQRFIIAAADYVAKSPVGRRPGPLKRWLLAPASGDLRLEDWDAPILQAGSSPPIVDHDFCGQRRGNRADVGAIQYSAGTCHLPTELERRHGRLFTDL